MTEKLHMVTLRPTLDGLLVDTLDLKLSMRGLKEYEYFKVELELCLRFIIKIPDGYPLEGAGPVFCAGITMYSPLVYWKVKYYFIINLCRPLTY